MLWLNSIVSVPITCCVSFVGYGDLRDLHVQTHSFPTRRSSDLQLRRHETPAHAEHARQEAHPAAEQDDDQRIDRQIGDWKVEIHGSRTMSSARTAPR